VFHSDGGTTACTLKPAVPLHFAFRILIAAEPLRCQHENSIREMSSRRPRERPLEHTCLQLWGVLLLQH